MSTSDANTWLFVSAKSPDFYFIYCIQLPSLKFFTEGSYFFWNYLCLNLV